MEKDIEKVDESIEIPETLPLIPLRDVVVFPYMIVPLFVGREKSIKAIDESLAKDRLIFLVSQKEASEEEPSPSMFYRTGTVSSILRMLKLPDGKVKILVQGLVKAEIESFVQETPFFVVKIRRIFEQEEQKPNIETEALIKNVKELIEKLVNLGKVLPQDVMIIINNINEPGRLADFISSNLGLKIENAQELLETNSPIERLKKLHEFLLMEMELLTVQQEIQNKAKEEIGKFQKEIFLKQQMEAIRKELGELDERAQEIKEYKEKIEKLGMSDVVKAEALKQLDRLEKMHPDSAESTITRTYLDWLIELPWNKNTEDNLDLKKGRKVLDEDHYDLEKIKDRILEFLAVRKLKKKTKGPILCFVGPPGVGKTSLGKSIARALGRKFVRISLGGMRDEAEIRGHRRTYVGALPGRIIQGIKQAGSNNPVFMLDEIDKIGVDFRGDPASALLEVLDPEQNHSFSDHYLNVPFDLSNVMFITTANFIDPIPPALKDRMEVIQLPGYTEEEKLFIAKKFLIPRQIEENGLKAEDIEFTDGSIKTIINNYTMESGLRNLEREIATVCRKVARKIAEDEKGPFKITEDNISQYLGPIRYFQEGVLKKDEIGVATGLAWTPYGGDILRIEASIMKGKGALVLTGHLGDVMKESAQAALTYARSRSKDFRIAPDFFEKHDIHIHVPAGAIPKDGPSAGITMAVALISAIKKTPVSRDVAMTGEITLRGNVLPIGGLKQKLLAALRGGIKKVILPEKNRVDLEDIPDYVKNNLKLVFVEHMDSVVKETLKSRSTEKNAGKKK
jgi:ATP-dependent Lon protease